MAHPDDPRDAPLEPRVEDQAEVHTKFLDRFSSNEDLLAYIQTPVGRRFLESGPAPVADDVRPVGAPFSRILFRSRPEWF